MSAPAPGSSPGGSRFASRFPGLIAILPVIGRAGWGFWAAVLLIGVPAVGVAIVFSEGDVERFEDRGGWSAALLLFGAYLWAVAALLRLIGFATSWLRMVEAIAIGALLVRLVLAAGILPGHDGALAEELTVDRLAAVVGVLLLVEVAIGVYAVIRRREAEIGQVITEKGALPLGATRWFRGARHRHRG